MFDLLCGAFHKSQRQGVTLSRRNLHRFCSTYQQEKRPEARDKCCLTEHQVRRLWEDIDQLSGRKRAKSVLVCLVFFMHQCCEKYNKLKVSTGREKKSANGPASVS